MPDTYISQFSGEEIDSALRAAQMISGASTPAELRNKLEIRGDTIPVSAEDSTLISEALTKIPTTSGGGVNPNLLDNWYFGRPVNQRGQTEYTEAGKYVIDRWWLQLDTSLSIVDGGVKISGKWDIEQFFENTLPNATYTLSMLYKDKTGTDDLRFIVANRSDGDIKGVNTKNASGLLSFTVTSDIINKLIIGFSGSTDNSVTLLAAKLELGDTQTLAHKENGVWVLNEIPDFGEQLRRCQRYSLYFEGGVAYDWTYSTNTVNVFIPTPVTMRAVPSLVLDDKHIGAINTVNGYVDITSIGDVRATSNGVSVDLNNSNSTFTIGTPVAWFGFAGHLTCDL